MGARAGARWFFVCCDTAFLDGDPLRGGGWPDGRGWRGKGCSFRGKGVEGVWEACSWRMGGRGGGGSRWVSSSVGHQQPQVMLRVTCGQSKSWILEMLLLSVID